MLIIYIIGFYIGLMVFLGVLKGIFEMLPMFTQQPEIFIPAVPVKREQTREELMEELRKP